MWGGLQNENHSSRLDSKDDLDTNEASCLFREAFLGDEVDATLTHLASFL